LERCRLLPVPCGLDDPSLNINTGIMFLEGFNNRFCLYEGESAPSGSNGQSQIFSTSEFL